MKEMKYSGYGVSEILADDTYNGNHYVIISTGFYPCAYVEIPKENSLYGKPCNEVNISCHGGICFSQERSSGEDDWYIGWDYECIEDYYYSKVAPWRTNEGKKWITEEIFEEVKNVIKQIIELGKQDKS